MKSSGMRTIGLDDMNLSDFGILASRSFVDYKCIISDMKGIFKTFELL